MVRADINNVTLGTLHISSVNCLVSSKPSHLVGVLRYEINTWKNKHRDLMNGQEAKIRRQISYDQYVCTGWVYRGLITGGSLHSSRQALRSSVTNSRTSYNVGRGSKLKRF